MNNKEQQNIQSEKTLTEIFKYNAEAGASEYHVNHLAIEQPESLRKQEKHDQQDCNTCYETATSQNSFYYFLKNLLHTYWFSDAKKATPY